MIRSLFQVTALVCLALPFVPVRAQYDPTALSRRDIRTNSEQSKLVIDSYYDKTTAFTSVNRALDPSSSPFLRSSAYVGGVDLRRRLFSGNYAV